jgi:hypothetical protein
MKGAAPLLEPDTVEFLIMHTVGTTQKAMRFEHYEVVIWLVPGIWGGPKVYAM